MKIRPTHQAPRHVRPSSGPALRIALGLAAALIGGCATRNPSVYEQEKFETNSQFSKKFEAPAGQTCDAARRALLSQGYIVDDAKETTVKGHKNFQPDGDQHVEIAFTVVCVGDPLNRDHSSMFVSATQDNYTRKKTSQSASVGVGPIGSVSLPFGSSDDSLVKVASATIGPGPFYQRYLSLVQHYLVVPPSAPLPANPTDSVVATPGTPSEVAPATQPVSVSPTPAAGGVPAARGVPRPGAVATPSTSGTGPASGQAATPHPPSPSNPEPTYDAAGVPDAGLTPQPVQEPASGAHPDAGATTVAPAPASAPSTASEPSKADDASR